MSFLKLQKQIENQFQKLVKAEKQKEQRAAMSLEEIEAELNKL